MVEVGNKFVDFQIDEEDDDVLTYGAIRARVRWSNVVGGLILIADETSEGTRGWIEIESIDEIDKGLKELENVLIRHEV